MKLAALCDFPFWEGRIGSAVRYDSLCRALARVCDLTLLCTAALPKSHEAFRREAPYRLLARGDLEALAERLRLPELPGVRADRQIELRAIRHIIGAGDFDAVLTPYFNRDWMTQPLPRRLLRLVDTMDCQSQRTASFARHGLLPTFPMTAEEEGRNLDRYDLALAMSDEDQAEFAAMSRRPIVTAPFRLPARPLYWVNPEARNLLFVAAQSPVNDLTLDYLLRQILPLVPRQLVLHVVGNVALPETCPENVRLVRHENVDDVSYIYGRVDLALNPVYAGGGVKTKTLEALSFGVPVLTSDEGARGLRALIPESLIANDKESFAWRIEELLGDHEARAALSREIIARYTAEDHEAWTKPFAQLLGALVETRREGGAA